MLPSGPTARIIASHLHAAVQGSTVWYPRVTPTILTSWLMRRPEPPNTGPQGLLQRATMPFARLFNDFLFCFTTCNLPHVLVNSIYFFLLLLVLWMLLWALISFAGSPKRCFSLSQRGIPADYSVCHSVLQFIAILGFILSHTWSQASFIPFSGISRMEEVAINRRKDVMPAG